MRGPLILLIVQALLLSPVLGAQGAKVPADLVPDNSRARVAYLESYSLAPLATLRSLAPVVYDNPLVSGPVRIEARTAGGRPSVWYINRTDRGFRDDNPGTVAIRRAAQGQGIEGVDMVVAPHGQVRVRIDARGQGAVALSVHLLDNPVALWNNLRFTIPITSFAVMPVYRMMELTAARIPWDQILWTGDAGIFAPAREVTASIRTSLPLLPDAEDGAMDEEGRLVTINSGALAQLGGFNCSGFAKWVIDGFYRPLVETRHPDRPPLIPVGILKERHLDWRGNDRTFPWEELRDPFFGLDWTRNLALELARTRGERIGTPESRDYRDDRVETYVEDKGYRVDNFPMVMYLAAVQNPHRAYLVSINGEWGTTPTLWQHYHIAVVFPWFDETGRFVLTVFERNFESTWAGLVKRYPRTYAHPVWFVSQGAFKPTLPR